MPLRSRPLLIALLVSVGIHGLFVLLLLLMPRLPSIPAPTPEQGTVELLMVEQKGSVPGTTGQPRDNTSRSQPPSAPPKADPAKDSPPPPQKLPVPTSAQPDESAVPLPEPATSAAADARPQPMDKPARTPPTPQATQQSLVLDLKGTESESNAVALGGHILPAKPDDRFRNRPPVYPIEAQMRGQHGQVTVVIHIGENGLAKSVDVVESSGVQSLDQAVMTAVRKWRFHPAMKDGRIVTSEMPFRFIFEGK